jgi:CheY-like chemotaxis protein
MFVIGRAVHEQIQIGNSVTIEVLRIGDKHVTLGIDAAKAVPLPRDRADTPTRGDGGSASGCDLSVLIVDDTPIHTWLVQKAFIAFGVERMRVAFSGQEALLLLGIDPKPPAQPSCYDLILMEFRLPDMPGLELLKRIRSAVAWRTVPIVVMSYENSEAEVSRFLEAGANAFFPKPETQEGFHQAVFRIADFWSHTCRLPATSVTHEQESLVC